MSYRKYKRECISAMWSFARNGGAAVAVGMDVFFNPGDIYLNGTLTVLEAVTGPGGTTYQFNTVTEANVLGTGVGTPAAVNTITFALGLFTYQVQQQIFFLGVGGALTAGRVLWEGEILRLANADQI